MMMSKIISAEGMVTPPCMRRKEDKEQGCVGLMARPLAVHIRPTGGAGSGRGCSTKGNGKRPFPIGRKVERTKQERKHSCVPSRHSIVRA